MQISLLFLFLPLSLAISSTPPDASFLLSFKSTSSDSSNSLSSWSEGTDPCTSHWLGVSCRNNRVTRLVLERLDLRGPLQPLLQLDQLRVLSLKGNNLTSLSLPLDVSPWKNMKLLYLSDNQLSGTFPIGLPELTRLRRVDLSGNRFVGHIPSQLNRLPHLVTLRLDRNSFTGTLFDFSPSLSEFNVSGNNLVGGIPKSLSGFPESAFAGNQNLCGKPLEGSCSTRVIKSDPIPILVSSHRHRKVGGKTVMAIILMDVAALGLIGGVFVYCCWRRRQRSGRSGEGGAEEEEKGNGTVVYERESREEEKMAFFQGCEGFESVEDLLRASAELLGKGCVGSTYKAVVEGGGGKSVVVKRVRERGRKKVGDGKEVDGLMREIGRLRDANVVGLRAYYWSKDEMLLVYDYMPNGSLHSLLHGNRGPGRTPLDWTTRLKLASGAAKGLTFLHTTCEPKLAHGHLTSSNVLVDHMGNACISDFALHPLIPSTSPPSSSPHKAYMAPEFLDNANHNGRKVSEKGDVYSFGVVLLEILTGKMAGEGDTDLVTWVRSSVLKESMAEVFDFELLRYKEMEEEMVALLQVALLCLGPISKERPKMATVHKMIEDIRARGQGTGGTHSPAVNDLSSNSSYLSDTPTFTSN